MAMAYREKFRGDVLIDLVHAGGATMRATSR